MVRLNAGGVKIKNPAASAEHHEGLPRITLEEIRSQAQKCIDESRKTQANPKLSAAWAIDFTIAKAKQSTCRAIVSSFDLGAVVPVRSNRR